MSLLAVQRSFGALRLAVVFFGVGDAGGLEVICLSLCVEVSTLWYVPRKIVGHNQGTYGVTNALWAKSGIGLVFC